MLPYVLDGTTILSAGIAAFVGPSVVAWYALRRLEREHLSARVLADRAELREILDQAVRDLHAASRRRNALEPFAWGRREDLSARAAALRADMVTSAHELDAIAVRLELRLPEAHPLAEALGELRSAMWDIAIGVDMLRGDAPDVDAELAKLADAGERFDRHYRLFVEAAREVARSHLQLEP